ncbi:MAG: hypothetical protein PUP92_10235 [Rhizonema sp. PD38]|nr:hypothetical protein [Rhizonema sp. PD38]
MTEHDSDLTILRKLLPPPLVSELVFYATNGRSSVYSAAGTLLWDRERPVVIVVDAETQNAAEIQEKISIANTLLLPAAPLGVPFRVLLAVPMIASILKSEPTIQTSLYSPSDLYEVLERLTSSQIIALQQHPLIQQLIEFFSSVTRQIA